MPALGGRVAMKKTNFNLDWIENWPIRQKLMLVIMLTCGAVLLLASGLLGTYQIYKFRETLIRNSTVMADILAENTQAALAFDDVPAAQKTLLALRADSYVTSACLYDGRGAQFATYIRPGNRTLIPAQPAAVGYHFESGSLVVFRPVILNGMRTGTIYLQTSLKGLYEGLRLFSGFAVLVFLVSGLAAFGLSSRLQRPISQPIHALTEAARRISIDKDFTISLSLHGRDEVGQLADALNQLLSSIEERDKALRSTNDLLRQEIAERKEAERALAESEQRLQALMQALPVGVSFSSDSTCQKITGNTALLSQFEGGPNDNFSASAPQETARGRQVQFFRDGHPIGGTELPLQRAVAENREIKPTEYEVLLPGGRRWFMEGSGAPIRDHQGNVIAGVAVTLDISERKRVENELRKAHAQLADKAYQLETLVERRTAKLRETIGELEAFSYSIAHDMRAPLRALQGFSHILLTEYATRLDRDGQRFLSRIANAADRMDKLIQDVLNYSRVVQGDFPLAPVDVAQLLRGIIDTYPNFASEKSEILIKEPMPAVLGNEAMLTQVFSNLIGNAVKFVAPGVKPGIEIRAEAKGPRIRLSVQDNGIGIAASQHEKIFEIFQQVEKGKGYEGTGIGLAIVKKAVERMGGTVGVQSELGRGSTFWIELAVAPQANP
jgi:signal transduction histidine kinase/HAMP domain-containing protein